MNLTATAFHEVDAMKARIEKISEELRQAVEREQEAHTESANGSADPIVDPRLTVLATAQECVTRNRNVAYGEPEDNFLRIAILHNAYNEIRIPGPENEIDVAVRCILTKVARAMVSPTNLDHWADIAGYAARGYQVSLRRQQRLAAANRDEVPGNL